MPLRVPPPEIPVINFLSPNKSDQGSIEFWNTENSNYVPLDVGAPHPNQRQYPNFRLGKQSPVQGDEKWYLRIWVSDETNPDWFNWAQKFSGEDDAFPIFIRTYREPRNSYTRRTEGQPLGTFYKLVVTDAGSGYANGTFPKITFDLPVVSKTSDPVAHGVVAPDGTISECVLDFGGEGHTANVEFNVDPPVNGNPASGIAYVQPQSAILTKEEASLFPEDSPFYAQYLQVVRVYETIPGPTFNETRLDVDGAELDVATTRKLCENITTGETINGNTWCKTTSKPTDIDIICEEEVACRLIPGIPMLSTKIDENGDIMSQSQTMVEASSLVTTNDITGGVWTKTFQQDIDGTSLVSWEIVQVRNTQNPLNSYDAEIPDLMPEEFRPGVPVTTHEETLIGDASPITLPLALGVLMEREAQLDAYTYRHTIRGREGISLPQSITNREIVSEFGGGDVNRVLTLNLDNSLGLEEGLTVLSCEIRKIDDQANGLAVRTTRQLNAASWPPLYGTHVDEKYGLQVDITRQTVDPLTSFPTPPTDFNTIVEYKPHDKWKTIQITSTIDVDNLPDDVVTYGGMHYSFPPELTDSIIDWAEATCGCSDSFSAVLIANMNQYSGMVDTRITEQFYNGPPPNDISATKFFPQAHHFGYAWSSFCGDDDGNCRTKSGAPEFHIPLCLHGDLRLCIGNTGCTIYSALWVFAATSPSGLPHGTYIMIAPHVERWRFGVFRRVLTEVLVP